MQTLIRRSELLVVSDIHLRGPQDERYLVLCELIDTLATLELKTFVLLGDVFDFFFGFKRHYTKKYAALGAALQRLAASGTTIYFYEGNHEFDLLATKWPHVNFVVEGDIALTFADGKKVLLNHGDLIYSSPEYRRFRSFVKSAFVKWAAFLLPSWLLEGYALHHAKVSRSRDAYRKLDHRALFQHCAEWLKSNHADIGVIGHFHVPYNEGTPDRRLLSVNSWDKINFLAFKEGRTYRGFYSQGWSVTEANETAFASLPA